jgi:hypothetical protein
MNNLVYALLEELKSYVARERSIDGFPNDTALEKGQHVRCVASTFSDNKTIHIWEIVMSGTSEQFIRSEHSDLGVTVFCSGPWMSLHEAKEASDRCDEDWFDLN